MKENEVKNKVRPCSELTGMYPFVQRCPIWGKSSVNGSVFVDEYLVFGNGTAFHSIRTMMDKQEAGSDGFTVRIKGFKCPVT